MITKCPSLHNVEVGHYTKEEEGFTEYENHFLSLVDRSLLSTYLVAVKYCLIS